MIALFASLAFLNPALAAPNPNPQWHLGQGLQDLAYAEYRICNAHIIPMTSSVCVLLELELVDKLNDWKGPVWIVQARYASDTPNLVWHDAIFQMRTDGRFSISSNAQHGHIASLITETLFWMDDYAGKNKPQNMQVGATWGNVLSSKMYVSSIDVTSMNGAQVEEASVVYQGGNEQSLIRVVEGFPFPTSSKVYLPLASSVDSQLRHEFELLEYSSRDSNLKDKQEKKDTENQSVQAQELAQFVSRICQTNLAYGTNSDIVDMCSRSGILPHFDKETDLLTDQYRAHDTQLCTGDISENMCYSGTITRTSYSAIQVDGQDVYLSLLVNDDNEDAVMPECPHGSWATVDIDDLQSEGSVRIGAVYCGADEPINAVIVEHISELVDPDQCATSEFASHDWAANVCDGHWEQ